MRSTLNIPYLRGFNLIIGFSMVFVGFILLLERLDVISVGLKQLWPSFIIIVGLAVLARGLHAHD